MDENKNNARVCGRVVWVATPFFWMTGFAGMAHAADAIAEPPTPQVVAPEAVDVEVFQGVRILTAPSSNAYPVAEVHDGREGWVRLNMMVDSKGKPYEVMVIDSSGIAAFERAAIKSLDQMSFEPARRGSTPIDSSFLVKMEFSLRGLAKGASPKFVSVYRKFTQATEAGNKEQADAQLANLHSQNLYEDAFENYGKYFYHRNWGTPVEQLADLRLAIAGEKRPRYLPKDVFIAALVSMFALQTKTRDFGGALATWDFLEPIVPAAMRPDLQTAVDEIHAIQRGSQPTSMSATIGKGSYWGGRLFRNRFSIAVTSGAVSEIKLRCEKQYLFFKYEPRLQYSIGAKKDNCGIQVVGDPGTVFELNQ